MGNSSASRHHLNLVSGVVASLYVISLWDKCNARLNACTQVVLCTTIAFHGTHAIGRGDFANRILMKYDVAAVFLSGFVLLFESPSEHVGFASFVMAFTTCAWLATWISPFRGLPFNIVATLIHLVGVALNVYMRNRMLCTFTPPSPAGSPVQQALAQAIGP